MWGRSARRREFEALSATPNGGIDLTGNWTATEKGVSGDCASFVQLEQRGTAVFGVMQSKLAANAALQIRGVVFDGRMVANYWRQSKAGMGSGMIDLVYEVAAEQLVGSASWHDLALGAGSTVEVRWRRA